MNFERELNAGKLYDDRIDASSNAVEAAGQWGSEELVPVICEEIFKKINLKSDSKVIEFGCGSGVLGEKVSNKCELYVGFDLSNKMIRFFKKNSKQPEKIHLSQASIVNVPFVDNSFDFVVMNGVTMYLDPTLIKKTFDEMYRVVNKSGKIFIGENVTPEGFPWELVWFQKLPIYLQFFAKFYIKIRKNLLQKNKRFGKKWILSHNELSPKYVKKYFEKIGRVTQTKSAASTYKAKMLKKRKSGNKRQDFFIELYS